MKKVRSTTVILFVLSVTTTGALAEKQPAKPSADMLLALVQDFYDQTKSISANFEQQRYTKAYDQKDRASGKVVFQKPGKMRWDYATPSGQVYLASSGKLLIYQAGAKKGESGQLMEQKLSDDDLPAVFSFLTGGGSLQENFRGELLASPTKTSDLYVLKLFPREPTPQFEELLFGVQMLQKAGARAAVVRRVVIVDHAGNWNQFDFKKIEFNAEISPKHFTFSPPAHTRRIKS